MTAATKRRSRASRRRRIAVADARNTDHDSGFGLDLSIARSTVLAHGGELMPNDREPHGLIVHIRLPGGERQR